MGAVFVLTRRSFVSSVAAVVASAYGAPAIADGAPTAAGADGIASRAPPDLTVLDLEVEGDKKLGTRFTLFIPNHLAKDEQVPLLVLLHGLGETWDQGIGAYAWVERYGLGTSYARLRRPPVVRTSLQLHLYPDARLAAINASLAAQPFRGMAVACPYTPNVAKLPNPEAALDAYAEWISSVVVPRARREAPVMAGAEHAAIDGVSLGGYVGLEVFLRRPGTFGAWGGVQSALNATRLTGYADKLALALGKVPRAGIHIETSEADPFREVNTALSALLSQKGVPHDFVVLPGIHDQVFLREAGTIEMLLWHDRRMR